MSHTPTPIASRSDYQAIFDNAIEAYQKKTKKDLRSHALLPKLESCDSPDAVLAVLKEQIPGFDQSRGIDDRLTTWLKPMINVIYTFSATIGGGISIVSFVQFKINSSICTVIVGIPSRGGDFHWNRHSPLSKYHGSLAYIIVMPNFIRRLPRSLLAKMYSSMSLTGSITSSSDWRPILKCHRLRG